MKVVADRATDEEWGRPVYLDYAATTPVDPEVTVAMLPWLGERFGNPSSSHVYGREARRKVEESREEVALLIGAEPDEIVFTASATEANNLAILGCAQALGGNNRRELALSAVEHPSVSGPFAILSGEGWTVRLLPVDASVRINLRMAERLIGPGMAFVSLMLANNETGTIQPVREIAAIARSRGALLHIDAAQAAGKIPVEVERLGADFLTLAGHKFYAPKGIGVLYVRRGTPFSPLMAGGGQEGGRRPGTENVPSIAALGTAARLARITLRKETARTEKLRERLIRKLSGAVAGLRLNGSPDSRLSHILNLSFPGVEGGALLEAAPGVAASTGSACHGEESGTSPVLRAMGMPEERARSAVRLSLGRFTTDMEIDLASEALVAAWRRLTS